MFFRMTVCAEDFTFVYFYHQSFFTPRHSDTANVFFFTSAMMKLECPWMRFPTTIAPKYLLILAQPHRAFAPPSTV